MPFDRDRGHRAVASSRSERRVGPVARVRSARAAGRPVGPPTARCPRSPRPRVPSRRASPGSGSSAAGSGTGMRVVGLGVVVGHRAAPLAAERGSHHRSPRRLELGGTTLSGMDGGVTWRTPRRSGCSEGRASTRCSTTCARSRSTRRTARRRTRSSSPRSPAGGSRSCRATGGATRSRRTRSTTGPTSGRCARSASRP